MKSIGSSSTMAKFGIVCLLPEEVRNYHQKLRLKIADLFGLSMQLNIPAHITIKYPFPVQDAEEIERFIQEFCRLQPKVEWLLQGFNYFKNADDYVLFIDVLSPEETRYTHSKFLDELQKISWVQWGPFDNANLHYHVTLAAQGINTKKFEAIWSFLHQQEAPRFTAFFDNIALIRIDDHSRSLYKIYRFENEGMSNASRTPQI